MAKCSSFKAIKNSYASLLVHETASLLKKDEIEEVVEGMETYRLTPALLNEHLPVLNTLENRTALLSSIPAATKAKLTRLFNKRHEEAKLKKKKGKTVTEEHLKFDPVL